MLEVEDALARVLECALPLAPESVPLMAALGRVLAVDVTSPEALPPFDNSAMDGFALPLTGGVAAAGSEFAVVGEHAAGDAAQGLNVACEIMTGARLPTGLDA
ncbi:MAG TPA: molybdopterin molybdenumtransferase MoeA, partial [Xanthomonadales bacterium]|nr:molybdopterin molybdenumtransferase MoeA [Xanthomonadales bacterium]